VKGFYPAKVMNNIDTKKKGRVQIKIEHIHWGLKDEKMFPWAIACNVGTGGGSTQGSSYIPEKDSYVWVWFEDADLFMNHPYYISDVHFTSKHPHNLFDTTVKSAISSAAAYPNAKYTYYKNGICIGVDASTGNPEIFLYHPKAYIFIDKNGKIKITSIEMELLAGTATSEKSVLGETLQTLISTLLDKLIAHTHPTGVGPSGPPVNVADFTAIKTADLPKILSAKLKNN